jgi:hypothetical protein
VIRNGAEAHGPIGYRFRATLHMADSASFCVLHCLSSVHIVELLTVALIEGQCLQTACWNLAHV